MIKRYLITYKHIKDSPYIQTHAKVLASATEFVQCYENIPHLVRLHYFITASSLGEETWGVYGVIRVLGW